LEKIDAFDSRTRPEGAPHTTPTLSGYFSKKGRKSSFGRASKVHREASRRERTGSAESEDRTMRRAQAEGENREDMAREKPDLEFWECWFLSEECRSLRRKKELSKQRAQQSRGDRARQLIRKPPRIRHSDKGVWEQSKTGLCSATRLAIRLMGDAGIERSKLVKGSLFPARSEEDRRKKIIHK